jgi:hypothetical protein
MADSIGYDESGFTFETVHDEAGDKLEFEEVGDQYIGEYLGKSIITFTKQDPDTGELRDESFLQLRFKDPGGPKVINAGYELEKFFTGPDEPKTGSIVRILLANKVDMGKGKNPMLSHRIDAATPINARSQKS